MALQSCYSEATAPKLPESRATSVHLRYKVVCSEVPSPCCKKLPVPSHSSQKLLPVLRLPALRPQRFPYHICAGRLPALRVYNSSKPPALHVYYNVTLPDLRPPLLHWHRWPQLHAHDNVASSEATDPRSWYLYYIDALSPQKLLPILHVRCEVTSSEATRSPRVTCVHLYYKVARSEATALGSRFPYLRVYCE